MTSRPAPPALQIALALLWVVLAPAAWAQTASQQQADEVPTLGEEAVQRIDLKAGPNLVSLHVYPESHDIPTLLGDALDRIILIKDSEGSVYAPRYSVFDLDRWRWTEAHLIYTKRPVSFEVRGRRIAEASTLDLDAGWGWVPFLAAEAMSPEEAFASLGDRLTRAEDVAGRVYPADGTAPPLTTLAPGQGYRVRLAEAGTLMYGKPEKEAPAGPSEPAPAPPTRIVVATIAEALALKGLAPGQVVEVGGYYASGDGGGGTFDVTASGVAPDGGTVFAPDEHVSGVVTETTPFKSNYTLGQAPRGEDVVFGSLRLDLLDSRNRLVLAVPGEHLHGHTYNSRRDLQPIFSYEDRTFDDFAVQVTKFFSSELGSRRDGQLRFAYRHTTSDLRLHRRDVGDELDVTWFGARTERESWGFDNQPVLCHALNVAQAMNEAGHTVRAVALPKTDVYGYFGTIEIPDGLTLRGGGGTYLATATDDLGNTYRPVRIRGDHTTLRLLDDEALKHIRMDRPASDPYHLPPDVKYALGMRYTRITVANNTMFAGLEDIVLDGNWEGNKEPWDEGWIRTSEAENNLRNAPGWSGFTATSHGKDIPLNQRLVVRNTAILGYGATGILGHADNTWQTDNLIIGDVLYNHGLYGTNGIHTNLTLTGFAWGHAVWLSGTINNLVYERAQKSPIGRRTNEVFGIRGGDGYDADEMTGQGAYTRSDGTVIPLTTHIVGFYADLRGGDSNDMFAGIGSNVTIRGVSASEPGVIVVPTNIGSTGIYKEEANGYQRALYHSNSIEHVLIYDTGSKAEMSTITGGLNVTDSVVRDVRVKRTGKRAGRSFFLSARRRNHRAWNNPQVQLFEGIHDGETHFIATVRVDDDRPAGMSVFVRNSSFDNSSVQLYNSNGGGGLDHLKGGGDPSKLRVYMEDVIFNMSTGSFQNSELFFAMTRFRDVTDRRSGKKSETRRTLRASDFNGREATVPLDLFWAPLDRDYVKLSGSGASRVISWEVVDADGDKLGGDKRKPYIHIRLSEPLGSRTLTVDAAVRPWEEGVRVPASLQ